MGRVMRLRSATLFFLSVFGSACASRPHLPPPTYEHPSLPAWEAPPPPVDPLDSIDESGDWAEAPAEEESSSGTAVPDEDPSKGAEVEPLFSGEESIEDSKPTE